jgi:plastocyanin
MLKKTILNLSLGFITILLIFSFVKALQKGGKGEIKGKVEIQGEIKKAEPTGWSKYKRKKEVEETDPAKLKANELKGVIVYLVSLTGQEDQYKPPSEHPTLEQVDATFVPHVLPVLVGTTVDVINGDKIYHNVFSYSDIKKFNIGRQPKGVAVPVNFDKIGLVRVFCDIHSHMSAFVFVLPNPYFTVPDQNGEYIIKNVPQGKWALKTWHDQLSTGTYEVTIEPNSTTTMDLILK